MSFRSFGTAGMALLAAGLLAGCYYPAPAYPPVTAAATCPPNADGTPGTCYVAPAYPPAYAYYPYYPYSPYYYYPPYYYPPVAVGVGVGFGFRGRFH